MTHTGAPIDDAEAAYLDEEGSLVLDTPLGAGLIADNDLGWVLDRLRAGDAEADEAQLAAALAQPAGASTPLRLILNTTPLPVIREDATVLPQCLGFVREPQPPTGTS